MKVLDLFSGIGGFSLGLEWAGMETIAMCEKDKFCRQVLAKHWPDITIHEDIRKLDGREYKNAIDVVCGGFPCQPFSVAGKQLGKEDDRHLWPEMFRLVQELRPTWVIGENVAGHINMGLDEVLADLENENYTARTFVIPACAVDAHHRRDRVWTVAHTSSGSRRDSESIVGRQDNETKRSQDTNTVVRSSENVAHSNGSQCQRNSSAIRTSSKYSDTGGPSWWKPEPDVGRVANGVPRRSHRLKQLGNAVVPQVVEQIAKSIWNIEHET